MQKNLNIDHICLAVKSIDRAIVKINKILGFEVKTKKVLNSKQNVNVVFMSKQGSIDIKLIEPGDKNSPLINLSILFSVSLSISDSFQCFPQRIKGSNFLIAFDDNSAY